MYDDLFLVNVSIKYIVLYRGNFELCKVLVFEIQANECLPSHPAPTTFTKDQKVTWCLDDLLSTKATTSTRPLENARVDCWLQSDSYTSTSREHEKRVEYGLD